jgi:trehalose-6-phosphate synthase
MATTFDLGVTGRQRRLVVVSNRVGDPRKAAAGGLAVALGDALSGTEGLWFGWSGQIAEASGDLKLRQLGRLQGSRPASWRPTSASTGCSRASSPPCCGPTT